MVTSIISAIIVLIFCIVAYRSGIKLNRKQINQVCELLPDEIDYKLTREVIYWIFKVDGLKIPGKDKAEIVNEYTDKRITPGIIKKTFKIIKKLKFIRFLL